ncbi:MAG TPA: hypothetical protein VNS53_07635 [Sphingomicrobium sp.]|jgi:hypothetical protein|nr:hypothetical protein [Sphingomicrobium sp.]
MSILLLLALQAADREVTTFYPLPPKEQQQQELRKAQGLPPVAPVKPEVAKAPEPAPSPKPVEPEQIKVVSVTKVSPDANVVFVPTPDASH